MEASKKTQLERVIQIVTQEKRSLTEVRELASFLGKIAFFKQLDNKCDEYEETLSEIAACIKHEYLDA